MVGFAGGEGAALEEVWFEFTKGELGAFSTASRVATAMNKAQAIATRTLMSMLTGMAESVGCATSLVEVPTAVPGTSPPLLFSSFHVFTGAFIEIPRNLQILVKILRPASAVLRSKLTSVINFW